tara:strand:+ start:3830 stop:4108 length:279 start_codon:yes stop_codon:yes gene_type:complete
MDIQQLYELIINEPIYLTITALLVLIAAYSILKKLFKLLLIILILLMAYVGYIMYTGGNLPTNEEINSLKNKGAEVIEKGIDKLDAISKSSE